MAAELATWILFVGAAIDHLRGAAERGRPLARLSEASREVQWCHTLPPGTMSLRAHVLLAVATATAVGVAEAMAKSVVGNGPLGWMWSTVVAIGVMGPAGALFGAVQYVVSRVLQNAARRLRIASWWASATGHGHRDREPVVTLHAIIFTAGSVVGALSYIAFLLLRWGFLSAEEESRGTLLLATIIACTGSAFLLGAVAFPWVKVVTKQADQRFSLPRPRSRLLRHVIFIALPIGVFLVPYLIRRAHLLGPLALPFWLGAFVVLERAFWLAAESRLPAHSKASKWLGRALLTAILVSSASTIYATSQRGPVTRHIRQAGVIGWTTRGLREVTDVDRDGFSSLFGGMDCAPLSPGINPGMRDEPGNGLDENCDGSDAEIIEEPTLPVFSDSVEPLSPERSNIILIVIDAVRWDHTGLGNPKKHTTPYLNKIAEESTVFTQAYSQSSATMMSLPSILSGRDPSIMIWEPAKRLAPARSETMLAKRFKSLGYETGLIGDHYVEEFLSRIKEDYDWYADGCPSREHAPAWRTGCAGSAAVTAIDFIDTHKEHPYFLTIYIEDPHAGYSTHGFGQSRFGRAPPDRYDGELAQVDRHLGFLVEYLKASAAWDDTIVVITSDHGEEFGEHGGKHHARTCYEESTHVPLLLHAPNLAPARVDKMVGLMDIAPTLLELTGASVEPDDFHGQSLLVPIAAPHLYREDRALPCAIISQRLSQGNFFRRALRTSTWTLLHEVLTDDFELYARENDPAEQRDVFTSNSSAPDVRRLLGLLNDSLRGNLRQELLTD